MRNVLFYDPDRVPRNWVDLLRPGQVAVFLLDVETSVVLDQDGVPVRNSAAESCFFFDSLADAKRFCQDMVERADHVRCDMYDERGMAVAPLYTIVNKRHEHRVGSKGTARLLMLSGAVSVVVSIPLFWYDWLAEGARIWPTLFGINLVVLGLRLLYWGYSALERLRHQETEQALAEARSESPGKAGH
jgi:hypothetical protein